MKTLLLQILSLCALIGCGSSGNLAGGGTDVGNAKVFGCIVDSTNVGVSGARVRLYAFMHDPYVNANGLQGALAQTTTNAKGEFCFDTIDTGTYTIIAEESAYGLKAIHYDLVITPNNVNNNDSICLSEDTLKQLGTLKIEIEMTLPVGGYLAIPGTDYLHWITSEELHKQEFILDSIPAGKIPSLYYRISDTSSLVMRAASNVEVEASGIVEVEFESLTSVRYETCFRERY